MKRANIWSVLKHLILLYVEGKQKNMLWFYPNKSMWNSVNVLLYAKGYVLKSISDACKTKPLGLAQEL